MDQPPPAARATFFVVSLASAIGIWGVVFGIYAARLTGAELVAGSHAHGEAALASQAMVVALFDAAHFRALGAINAVVSLLLVFASSTLLARRPTAPWWMTQAALANAGHAILRGVFIAMALRGVTAHLPTVPSRQELTTMMIGVGSGTAFFVLIYLALAWRAGRPDIRSVLRPSEETPS